MKQELQTELLYERLLVRIDLTCKTEACRNKGTYELRVKCINCGNAGRGVFSKTHEAIGRHLCPRCETGNMVVV